MADDFFSIDKSELTEDISKRLVDYANLVSRTKNVALTPKQTQAAVTKGYRAMNKEVRQPVRGIMRQGAPGVRLKKKSPYQVAVVKKTGAPIIKAGKVSRSKAVTDRPPSIAQQLWFSHFLNTGTRERKGRGSIEGTEWMYKNQKKVIPHYEKAFVKVAEPELEKYLNKRITKTTR